MITLKEFYMGRDKTFADDLTEELQQNALDTVSKANELLRIFGQSRGVNSGWRPVKINSKVPKAAKLSNHMICKAIDIADDDGSLDKWCLLNVPTLEKIGLWLESPTHTPRWCHVQTIPPRSGNRIFIP